jgi:hypothetical protein
MIFRILPFYVDSLADGVMPPFAMNQEDAQKFESKTNEITIFVML